MTEFGFGIGGVGSSSVGQGELKTDTGTASRYGSNSGVYTLSGAGYTFKCEWALGGSSNAKWAVDGCLYHTTGGDLGKYSSTGYTAYGNRVTLYSVHVSYGALCRYRYITASGPLHWLFGRYRSGNLLDLWEAPDHPSFGYYGRIAHPFDSFELGSQKNKDDEMFCCVLPDAMVEKIRLASWTGVDGQPMTKDRVVQGVEIDYTVPEKTFPDVFAEVAEIDQLREDIWPDIPITTGLAKIDSQGNVVDDSRFQVGNVVEVVKHELIKPDFLTMLQINEK